MDLARAVTPAGEGEEEDLQVEPGAPGFDVIDVVLDAAHEVGVASQAVDLGPAGHAGFDEVAREVVRNLAGEAVGVVGAFGARADEAHVAAQDVPELGKFVEVPAAHPGADAQEAGVVGGGALREVVGGGGVGAHAAEFPHAENARAGAEALLGEKGGGARGFAANEAGEDEHEGGGNNEADQGAGEIDGAF